MWWFGFCILIIQNKVWKKKYFAISGCKIVEKKIKIKKKIKKKFWCFGVRYEVMVASGFWAFVVL